MLNREQLNNLSSCIYWDGKFALSGYGVLPNGKEAHVALWEENNGSVPNDRLVGHTCGVRGCVNLSHLYIKKPLKAKYNADYVEVGRGRNRRVIVAHEVKHHVKGSRALKRIRLLEFTQEELHELFRYEEGRLYWKESAKGRQIKKPVGTIDNKIGIVACSVQGIRCGLHELMWIYHEGQIEEDQRIIFKDGDPINCDIDNLTLVEL